MEYALKIDNTSYRLFKKLPKDIQGKIIEKAQILKANPLAGSALKGQYRYLRSLHFSFKGTSYRIIYQVFANISTVIIRLADTRENIYRQLVKMKIKPLPLDTND